MRVVLDTNVVVSALLNPKGRPAEVVMAAVQGHLIPLFDARVLEEYRDVLLRPKFAFDATEVTSFVADIEAIGELVDVGDPRPHVRTPDPDDRPFVEVALAGRAEVLVTGNRRHFPDGLGVRIVSPAEMIDELRARGAQTSVAQLLMLLGAPEDWVVWAGPYGADLERSYDECSHGELVAFLAERLEADRDLLLRARVRVLLGVATEGIEDSEPARRAIDTVERFEHGDATDVELLDALRAASRVAHPDGIVPGVGGAWSLDATDRLIPIARDEEHAQRRLAEAARIVRSIIPFSALGAPRRWAQRK